MADLTVGKPLVATTATRAETVDTLELEGGVEYDGSELISNGGFVGNADGWTLNDSGSYADGKVTVLNEGSDDPFITAPVTLQSGTVYLLQFTISDATDGQSIYFDNCSASSKFRGNGKMSFVFTSDFSGADVINFDSIDYENDTGWTIDDVSCRALDTELIKALTVSDGLGRLLLSLGAEYLNSIAIGANALANNLGQGNYAFGDGALGANTTGEENFAAGRDAGYNLTTAKRCVAIGPRAKFPSATEDDQTVINNRIIVNSSGIHFNGGTPVTYLLSNPTTLAEIRTVLLGLGLAQ